jgi:GNAT superfamily N-acetyltransferase
MSTTSPAITIKPLSDDSRAWVEVRSEQLFNGPFVISKGSKLEPAKLPGFVAMNGDDCIGLATFRIDGKECELVTIDALVRREGVGTRLLAAVEAEAIQAGCRRIWLITTNDNLDALRFYQRRDYTIAAIHVNALKQSRKLKPTIPLVGNYGIPMNHEIELEKFLHPGIRSRR